MPSSSRTDLSNLPDPNNRYRLGELIGCGTYGKIYLAEDSQNERKKVAVKVQQIGKENENYLEIEYQILKKASDHPNIVDFFGAYSLKSKILFVIEYCEGGTVKNLVSNLISQGRTLLEEHIAHIVKEVMKALVYLHQKNIVHRNVRADNIFLTRAGEIKLSGFSICQALSSSLDKTGTFIGSPSWIAPEVILAKNEDANLYDNRCDVWSLGITAIEIADGKPPYHNMYPTRTIFQVVRNPPPTLYRPFNWSLNFGDFIEECLVPNPDHRPHMEEIITHPFIADVPENNYHLSMEIKALVNALPGKKSYSNLGYHVENNTIFNYEDGSSEVMFFEDLAAMDNITERNVLLNFMKRFQKKQYQVYAGDVLVTANNNVEEKYPEEIHRKYICKSQSENEPHVFAIADSAYQSAVHHSVTQKIVLLGESGSGKTKNYLHCVDHLLFIGKNDGINVDRFKDAIFLIHAFTNASTPLNVNSTRCILNTDLSFGGTGKATAITFKINLIEKHRISIRDAAQGNFHVLYYFYDGLVQDREHKKYHLNAERDYRYLRTSDMEKEDGPRTNIGRNADHLRKIKKVFVELGFDEEKVDTIFKILSAILLLGEIRFHENETDNASISNMEVVKNIAKLLDLDENKFAWVLTNYCVIRDGLVVRRKTSCDESEETRDVLANNLYSRIVDYIISYVNHTFSAGKDIFGERYLIQILDYYGFESFKTNNLWQLYVNSFNEEIRYYYSQKNFNWEMLDLDLAEVEYKPIAYYDNQKVLDELLGKNGGLLSVISHASKMEYNGKYISDCIYDQDSEYITSKKPLEFAVAHYAGKVYYDSNEMPEKNRDFMPPEIFQTLRSSKNPIVKSLFTEKFGKNGNLMLSFKEQQEASEKKTKYMSAFHKMSSVPRFSQTKRMRNSNAIFKSVSTDILTDLSRSGGVYFVICIRANLEGKPLTFCGELIRHQLKAMLVVQTAKMRKEGYSCRISFAEFLRRYKFLAFDWNEEVEINAENCRLLLIRLKLEGWVIGKRTVFLKYYVEEYLSRLYENQVKKIIKMQSMMRSFLTRCKMKGKSRAKKIENTKQTGKQMPKELNLTEDDAAKIIQKTYRSHHGDKSPNKDIGNDKVLKFIKPWALKWKRNSLFGVLLQYRVMRIRDFFNFSQQVHFYNEKAFHNLQQLKPVDFNKINREITSLSWRDRKPVKYKMNFLIYNIPYYDCSNMLTDETPRNNEEMDENWHKPLRWKEEKYQSNWIKNQGQVYQEETDLVDVPFDRKPDKKWEVPAIDDNTDEEKPKRKDQKMEPYRSKPKPMRRKNSGSTKPANKDFDYIRSPVLRPVNQVDPVNELKAMARRDDNDDDNPPFNFRGMLRKTNFQRESLKCVYSNENSGTVNLRPTNTNSCNVKEAKKESVSMVLAPGMVLQGSVYNL